MSEEMSVETEVKQEAPEKRQGVLDRNPKLAILLIAGVFYLILFGMVAVVLILVWLR